MYAMMQAQKHVTLLWKTKVQSNDDYKKVLEALINEVETYGGGSMIPYWCSASCRQMDF